MLMKNRGNSCTSSQKETRKAQLTFSRAKNASFTRLAFRAP